MEEDKVLHAITQLGQSMQAMQQNMQSMQQSMQEQFSGVNNRLDSMDKRLTAVEDHIGGMEADLADVKDRTGRVELLLEHDIPKQINLLAEGHSAILERLPEADELDGIHSRVRTLERVVAEHTSQINTLKQAN